MSVYFIQAGKDGPIKIGSARDPIARLLAIQCGHHEKLRLIGAYAGGNKEEKELHSKFSGQHIRGEWFNPIAELLLYIKTHTTMKIHTAKAVENKLSEAEVEALQAMVEEESFGMVADRLQISPGTLKSLLARGRGRRSTVTVVRSGIVWK